jgi:hypothetical protein
MGTPSIVYDTGDKKFKLKIQDILNLYKAVIVSATILGFIRDSGAVEKVPS